MKPNEVKDYFRTGYNFSKITKMSANTLVNWVNQGYVPFFSQKKIEKITKGALVADWNWQEIERKKNNE